MSPVQPLGDWPPVGWLTNTANRDTRTHNGESTCEPADGTIVWLQTDASPLGECLPRPPSLRGKFLTAGLFEAQLCAKDGATSGKVLFSDSKCSAPVHALMAPTGCFNGVITTCPTNSTALPTLPSITRANFQGGKCDPADGMVFDVPPTTDHLIDGLCLDGQRVQCVVDAATGAQSAVVTIYEREKIPGVCNTVKGTNTHPVGTCVQMPDAYSSERTSSARFSCPSSP